MGSRRHRAGGRDLRARRSGSKPKSAHNLNNPPLRYLCGRSSRPDLVDLFGLCGGLGLGSVAWIIPALAYLRMCSGRLRILALITLLIGAFITIGTVISVMRHILQRDGASESCWSGFSVCVCCR